LSSQQRLEAIAGLVTGFPQDRWDLSPRQRLDLATQAASLASRMQVLASMLLAEADRHGASMRAAGTPSSTYLATQANLTRKQAAGLVFEAQRLEALPQAREAGLAGSISLAHVKAVGKAMEQMPSSFTPTQTKLAESLLVGLAGHHTPDDVIREASSVARQVDPVDAERKEAERLSRERVAAWRNRSLNWWREAGSIVFKGSLPQVEGEAFTVLIDAYANQARRHSQDAKDPQAEETTFIQRRADALIALVKNAQNGDPAPTLGGDRPVVVVTLDLRKLQEDAADAGLLPSGAPLAAGDLRRLCCDANLVPAVLGTKSELLDVGRAFRLVTPAIRRALTLRDKHCAFPNCDTSAALCDAHHITPWWDGGATALANLVLLCPHHHGLIEPDRNLQRDQWSVSIHDDGHPVFTPPGRFQTAGTKEHHPAAGRAP